MIAGAEVLEFHQQQVVPTTLRPKKVKPLHTSLTDSRLGNIQTVEKLPTWLK